MIRISLSKKSFTNLLLKNLSHNEIIIFYCGRNLIEIRFKPYTVSQRLKNWKKNRVIQQQQHLTRGSQPSRAHPCLPLLPRTMIERKRGLAKAKWQNEEAILGEKTRPSPLGHRGATRLRGPRAAWTHALTRQPHLCTTASTTTRSKKRKRASTREKRRRALVKRGQSRSIYYGRRLEHRRKDRGESRY